MEKKTMAKVMLATNRNAKGQSAQPGCHAFLPTTLPVSDWSPVCVKGVDSAGMASGRSLVAKEGQAQIRSEDHAEIGRRGEK
jgi:hypothetical protein